MKHLRRFNESLSNFKELEFDEDMMYKTSAIINLIPNKYEANLLKAESVIKETLSEETFEKLFHQYMDMINKPGRMFNFFVTTVMDEHLLNSMFNNVVTHEGADMEEEFVSALEINGKVVLLLHSPDRGSGIRVQDDKYTIKFEEVLSILKSLCEIYNEKL